MEVNREEALRCLDIAQKRLQNNQIEQALKFTKKSLALYPTKQAENLLSSLANQPQPDTKQPNGSPTTPISSNEGLRNRSQQEAKPKDNNSSTRSYTKEQVEAVAKIKRDSGDFYKVLSVDKGCEEVLIKKAYRKLALQFHPDKNSAPGAAEAFKLVSKAFTVLSDPDKRASYDRYGGDPEQRNGGGGGSSFNPQFGFQDEVSPEDLFNMFFGGMANTGFSQATFVGPDGRRYMRSHNNSQRRPRSRGANVETSFNLLQLLPILLLFFFSMLSSFFTPSTVREPDYLFERGNKYTKMYTTSNRNFKYYCNLSEHREFKEKASPQRFSSFQRDIEVSYVRRVYQLCLREQDQYNTEKSHASGWFGIGRDEEKLKELKSKKLPRCEEYQRLTRN